MGDPHACSDAAFLSDLDGSQLIPHIVRALAQGEPVASEDIASSADVPQADVERLLRFQPGIEWSDDGRLVGFGLTQRPTEHRLTVTGKTLYTWCATDTLLFTVILGHSTLVESTGPATREPIRIELDPDAVLMVAPHDVVVSQPRPADPLGDLRTTVCQHGRFLSARAAAGAWLADHPDGQVLEVAGAFEQCREACEELGWIGGTTP
jgi:alkylmercury lyase